MLSSKR